MSIIVHIKNNWLILAGVFIGSVAGFAYWNFIGCTSDNCTITSVWYNSTVYGALIGGLVFSIFKTEKEKTS
ncbi:MAG: DUF6132 family protein [Bacteroidota bacterium]|nr:DUF6132 family protein [Bacteroidota bacterium]